MICFILNFGLASNESLQQRSIQTKTGTGVILFTVKLLDSSSCSLPIYGMFLLQRRSNLGSKTYQNVSKVKNKKKQYNIRCVSKLSYNE